MPVGAGTFTDRAISALTTSTIAPSKTVTLVRDGVPEKIRTDAATVADLLLQQNIVLDPADAIDADPSSALTDGETIDYRAAVAVTLTVDGTTRTIRSALPSVAALLVSQGIAYDAHDRVDPAPATSLTSDEAVDVEHLVSWTETVHQTIAPPVKHRLVWQLPPTKTKVISPGRPGEREVAYLVSRTGSNGHLQRALLGSRIIRPPKVRIVAAGVGAYAAIASVAIRGFSETMRMARSAMHMVATAYTADCNGCSGITASGVAARHGVVAVDPSVIPLGTRLYIPGYGPAVAGDTGSAIHGNRIDLGFDSRAAAMTFGRRSIIVYVLPH